MPLLYDHRLTGCVVCAGRLVPFEEKEIKGYDVAYEVCTGCGLVQMNPRPSPEALTTYYEEEYRSLKGDEDGDVTGDAQTRRAHQQAGFVGTPKRHLDVGCSMGTLLTFVDAPVKVGVEPGVQHREMAEAAGIEMYETVAALIATDPEPFDLITWSHVVEHLHDPVAGLAELTPLLAPGGRLMVEVPYLYRSIAYEIDHLSVFAKPTLELTLRAAGFEPVEWRIHVHRQGGLGNGRNLGVMSIGATPVPPPSRTVIVPVMQARRRLGFAPQLFYRWRRRQQRMVARNIRKVTKR